MLGDFVALGVAQSRMQDQFGTDAQTGAKARRAELMHQPRRRAAFLLAMRVLAKAQARPSRSSHAPTRVSPE